MHLQNFLTKRNFKAGSWISKQEFAQKRRISRSYCSEWIKRSKQPARWRTSSILINYGKRFLWLWRIRFDEDGRIEMVPRYCFSDLRNHRAKSRDKTKGRKNLTLSGRLKNVFSGKQLGFVQEETLVIFHTHATGDRREDNVERSGDTQDILSSRSKHPLQYRKWKTQTDGKSLNSLKASPVTRAENSLSMVGKMKISSCDYRHHPVCRGRKSGNRCHGSRFLCRQADCKSNLSAKSKRR